MRGFGFCCGHGTFLPWSARRRLAGARRAMGRHVFAVEHQPAAVVLVHGRTATRIARRGRAARRRRSGRTWPYSARRVVLVRDGDDDLRPRDAHRLAQQRRRRSPASTCSSTCSRATASIEPSGSGTAAGSDCSTSSGTPHPRRHGRPAGGSCPGRRRRLSPAPGRRPGAAPGSRSSQPRSSTVEWRQQRERVPVDRGVARGVAVAEPGESVAVERAPRPLARVGVGGHHHAGERAGEHLVVVGVPARAPRRARSAEVVVELGRAQAVRRRRGRVVVPPGRGHPVGRAETAPDTTPSS